MSGVIIQLLMFVALVVFKEVTRRSVSLGVCWLGEELLWHTGLVVGSGSHPGWCWPQRWRSRWTRNWFVSTWHNVAYMYMWLYVYSCICKLIYIYIHTYIHIIYNIHDIIYIYIYITRGKCASFLWPGGYLCTTAGHWLDIRWENWSASTNMHQSPSSRCKIRKMLDQPGSWN